MGIGLLILVSVGKENLYFSAQPEITFFKIAYRRHTNYSIEQTPQYFKTTPDFGRRCTVNISKNADLLGMIYLYVELPNIQLENFNNNNNKEFAWVNKIGLALINFIEFEIGGTIIDRHYGDWLNIWFELTNMSGNNIGYDKMIGNIPNLYNYSQTKLNYKLYIPLCFWFCLDSGITLPIISLIYNDIKIHVDFNDFNYCYKISPSNYLTVNNNFCLLKKGELFYQNYKNNENIGEFIYFDIIKQQLFYNPIKGQFVIPTTNNDNNLKLIGMNTNFELFIKSNSIIINDNSYFKFNTPSLIDSYLLINYIYLDNFERYNFINNSHEYLIPVVQSLPEKIIYSTYTNYKLSLINPVKLLVWRAYLLCNKNSNNLFNYTTTPYTKHEENIINNNLIVTNSINRMNLDSSEYYTLIPKYQYNFTNKQNGIYIYSFGLYPKDLQPSGTLNFSKLDDAYLQLNMNKIINYQNPASIRCYSIQYNLLRIKLGIAIIGY
jgi:hypothetical protein